MTHRFLKNNPDQLVRESKTYIEIIKKRAVAEPDKVVYRFLEDGLNETESFTFSQIDTKARALGAALQQYAGKGDRVLLLFPAGLKYVAAIFSCFYSGMIAVPAYPPRRNRNLGRVLSIVEDAGVNTALVTKQVYDDISRNFKDNDTLRKMNWVIYDEVDNAQASYWQEIEILPHDVALLQYTSGSTGNPKGVMLTQLNLLYNSEYIRLTFDFDKATTVGMNWLPIFHDMGLIGGVLQASFLGAENIGMPPVQFVKTPGRWLQCISKYKATVGGGPNFGYDYCVDKVTDDELKSIDLSGMKTFYCGAEPVRKKTMDAFVSRFSSCGVTATQMYPVYGLAEATLIVTGGKQDEPPVYLWVDKQKLAKNIVEPLNESSGNNAVLLTGVGTTWLDTEIAIVNPRTFERAGRKEVGEIWVSGPTVAKGYWNKPEETQRTFDAYIKNSGEGPFLRTGDLGFVHNNELYITGRLKDLIIIRGVNHYPSDIEYTVSHAHVDLRNNACAAFSVQPHDEEQLVIVQELERNALRKENYDAVFDAIRKALFEEHELEAAEIVLIRTGTIPLTSSGKIQRRQTRYNYLSRKLNIVAQWKKEKKSENEPETNTGGVRPTEENIKEFLINWIVKNQHFSREQIRLDKEITAYGVDSLSAVTLEQEISVYFGFDWHVSSFMLNPTIDGLAKEGVKLWIESRKEKPH